MSLTYNLYGYNTPLSSGGRKGLYAPFTASNSPLQHGLVPLGEADPMAEGPSSVPLLVVQLGVIVTDLGGDDSSHSSSVVAESLSPSLAQVSYQSSFINWMEKFEVDIEYQIILSNHISLTTSNLSSLLCVNHSSPD